MYKLCTRFHLDVGGNSWLLLPLLELVSVLQLLENSWQTTITKDSPECIELFAARYDVGGGWQQNNVHGFDCNFPNCDFFLFVFF